jgi:O-antigen biosynthesis protein WbqV
MRQVAHIFYPDPFFIAEVRILFLGCVLLVGFQASGRICYRYYRFWRGTQKEVVRKSDATLIIGHISEVEGALRSVEQGTVAANVVGSLLLRGDAFVRDIRGCKIFGFSDDLESTCDLIAAGGQIVTALLLTPGLLSRHEEVRNVKRIARRLGLSLLKIEAINVGGSTEMRLEEFLFRERKIIDHRPIDAFVSGKTFLITGGGGTIGGDIALRAVSHGAETVWLLDQSELGLQSRRAQIKKEFPKSHVESILGNVRDVNHLKRLLTTLKPDVVIHAAALKHVDLTEENWQEAIKTNVFGTANVLEAADYADIPVLVNISTDKAADPVGMLGLTKHFSERLVAAFGSSSKGRRFSVRFGNVLGSSGSVIETFLTQISSGGPITITHPDVKRFFMSRDEAAQLVLSAASSSESVEGSGTLFVLQMGEQISIRNLANELIEWAGLVPEKDIPIVITGLRPGERLEEKLVGQAESLRPTRMVGIDQVELRMAYLPDVLSALSELRNTLDDSDLVRAKQVLQSSDRMQSEAINAQWRDDAGA